jgi:putative flippase GtrA
MTLLCTKQITSQFIRYSLVGIVSNVMGYSTYLFFTSNGVDSVMAMSILYSCACLASFSGNKHWTFVDTIHARKYFPRYVLIQIIGYLTNLSLLFLLHKQLGFPHQWVQLLAFPLVATELFILNKYYVFRGAQNGVKP